MGGGRGALRLRIDPPRVRGKRHPGRPGIFGQGRPPEIAAKTGMPNGQKLGKQAAEILTGTGSPMDHAMRVMRTELNRAHGEAYMMGGEDHPDFAGWRFLLSSAHPKPDICDLLSSQNLHGLGPGVYPSRDQCPWPAHPNTLSFVEIVFKDEISDKDRTGKETSLEALARLTPAQQKGVLGMMKQAVFKEGKLATGMIRTPWKTVKSRLEKQGQKLPDMPERDTRDSLTRQMFNRKDISITGLYSDIAVNGVGLNKDVLPRLLGALDESKIRVTTRKNRVDFEVRHTLLARPMTYMLDKSGILHGVEFYLSDDAPEGLGTRMMATTLLTAARLGIPEVQLKAAGKPDNGYYTWPRLGFNGVLPDSLRKAAGRAGFSGAETILDVFDRPGGREWWKANGARMEVSFTLDREGRSMKTLLNYLLEKKVSL